MREKLYDESFQYSHKNPYHDKLEEFGRFVLRDNESESFAGKWNKMIFEREAPLYAEIGSGYGHFMLDFCEKHPEINYVGMDFRFKRTYYLARKLDKHPHQNFRFLRARGERIQFIFGENEVDNLFYFFPDPWPKKRHHKKRLFQQPFIEAAYKVLKPRGVLYIKTDHDGYAEWMAEAIEKQDLFHVDLKTFNLRSEFPEHFLASFETKFEKIFLQKNIPIKAFQLTSKKS